MSASETPVWKRVAWGLVLVGVIVAGDRVMAAGLHQAVMSTGNRFAVMYRGEAPGGILILGNSRGVNTFHQPTIEAALGRPVFNASSNGTPTELSDVLLRDYVARNPKPDLVVIEVTGIVAGANQISNFFPFARESERLSDFLDQELSPTVSTARRLFRLYNYNGEVLFRSLAAGASDQGEINRYKISPALVAATERMEPEPLDLRERNLDALRRMIAFCEEEGIEVRLAIGPYLPAFRERIDGYDAWVARVREAAGGARIWDYSEAIDDVTAFADRLHMNYRGAQILTPRLVADGFFDAGTRPTAGSTLTDSRP